MHSIINFPFDNSYLIFQTLLLGIIFLCSLTHIILHLFETYFLSEHMSDFCLISFDFEQPLHIVKTCSLLQCLSYFTHSFFHIVQISFWVKQLSHLVVDVIYVSLGWKDLFDVADALILNFKCVVDSFESQLYYILDVCPLRICFKEFLDNLWWTMVSLLASYTHAGNLVRAALIILHPTKLLVATAHLIIIVKWRALIAPRTSWHIVIIAWHF